MKSGFFDRRTKIERIRESRRMFPRFYRKMDLAYTSDRSIFFSKIENLSLRGIFVSTRRPDPVGTICYIRFFLKDQGAMVRIKGVVTRIERDQDTKMAKGMGIRFIDMSDSARKRIAAFLLKEGGLHSFPQVAYRHTFWL